MKARTVSAVLAVFAALALGSCGELPDRADPESASRPVNETPQHPAHQRTLNQGEAERIGN